ncbi:MULTISPECIES: hypothetical protein [Thalassobaculum]|uniref:Uncharacterized protein n=1 Tax=Thalassobaculum litoreum DSM 18839 TaxID=1123362 RepID=A0A8G2BI48_9PROT|nr:MULTISPECIES: hypothetical protein [Thalassobaculum]SDF84559.1 hypothetical protein SAMN05660686_02516 [Thalassobaculum litoreum DSM 18839]
MARTKSRKAAAFTTFAVTYEDDSISSNRRVDNDRLDQSFGDSLLDLARIALEEQDAEIARRSNRPRPKIKTVSVT